VVEVDLDGGRETQMRHGLPGCGPAGLCLPRCGEAMMWPAPRIRGLPLPTAPMARGGAIVSVVVSLVCFLWCGAVAPMRCHRRPSREIRGGRRVRRRLSDRRLDAAVDRPADGHARVGSRIPMANSSVTRPPSTRPGKADGSGPGAGSASVSGGRQGGVLIEDDRGVPVAPPPTGPVANRPTKSCW
jgi:hypothetical protein